jgi:hypothetical protein
MRGMLVACGSHEMADTPPNVIVRWVDARDV